MYDLRSRQVSNGVRGFPTLVSPTGKSCVKVREDLEDVRIASILMDANTPLEHGYTSRP